jgi:hypothetical protein
MGMCLIAVARRTLREFTFAAFVKLATIKAVVNDDAIVLCRTTPAIARGMFAQIIDRVDVVSVHPPRQRVGCVGCPGPPVICLIFQLAFL